MKLDKSKKDDVAIAAHLIPGWCYIHEMTLIYELCRKSKIHVEIGTFCGKTTFIAACAMKNGSEIITVDAMKFGWIQDADPHFRVLFDDEDEGGISWPEKILDLTIEGIKKLAPDTRVMVVKKPSLQASVDYKMANPDIQIDSIFLDGNHSRDGVVSDIASWYPMLKPGGILFGHDYWNMHPGVIEAVNECFGKGGVYAGGFHVHDDTRIWIHTKPEIKQGTPSSYLEG